MEKQELPPGGISEPGLMMLTSRVSSLNETAIFIGLLFWGWLWVPVGLIIATPVLMIIKTLCDHVSNLRAVGSC